MLLAAILLTLTAAAMHALWNALLKPSGDPWRLAALATVTSALLWSPVVLVAWLLDGRPGVPPEAWILAVASAVLELLYLLALSYAYERGELSSVYPIARGTAPLVAVFIGIVVLGEHLTPMALLGVALLLCGVWVVRHPDQRPRSVLPALSVGLLVGLYSSLDSEGVHLAQPWLYGWILWALTAGLVAAFSYIRLHIAKKPPGPERKEETTPLRAGIGQATLIGFLMTATYLLVLIAFRLAPLAIISPLRETSVVIAALWGIWGLKERRRLWLRLGGAAAVALGAALLSL